MPIDDEDKPRSLRGKYNEKNYSPIRRAYIEMTRARGGTSAADRAKVEAMRIADEKKASRLGASRGKSSENILAIDPVSENLSIDDTLSSEERYRKNFQDIFGKEKKAKGGLVGRGQGKAIRLKTTKFY